jgi:hypothetical protein
MTVLSIQLDFVSILFILICCVIINARGNVIFVFQTISLSTYLVKN